MRRAGKGLLAIVNHAAIGLGFGLLGSWLLLKFASLAFGLEASDLPLGAWLWLALVIVATLFAVGPALARLRGRLPFRPKATGGD